MTKNIMFSEELSPHTCQSFATHFWLVTHSLENAALLDNKNMEKFIHSSASSWSDGHNQ